MKTNMNNRREPGRKSDENRSIENCKLERLKMTGAYGLPGEARAWATGIAMQQSAIGCAAARAGARRSPAETG